MKKKRIIRFSIPVVLIAALFLYVNWTRNDSRNEKNEVTVTAFEDATEVDNLNVIGPVSYKNLEIWLLAGDAALNDQKYVALEQALKDKLVTVHETGSVNELKMDNPSNEYIYINSGDIVKGGRQDRTLQYDVIIAPGKKNVDLASFCVEHGRWSARANESPAAFSGSSNSLSSKELKVAAKYSKSQTAVWDKVEKYQAKANHNLSQNYSTASAPVEVRSDASATSLELTLENKEIQKLTDLYQKEIRKQIGNREKIIGFAYLINGKLYGMDVFNNHQLFNDLFDKLLNAAIAEAISEKGGGLSQTKMKASDINDLLHGEGKVFEQLDVNEITAFTGVDPIKEKNLVVFTTTDKQKKNWLHRNWLNKTEE